MGISSNPQQHSACQAGRFELHLVLPGCVSPAFPGAACAVDALILSCPLSFLLVWFCFHPNAYHLAILTNVWSYLAICFHTPLPGSGLSRLYPTSCFGISLL